MRNPSFTPAAAGGSFITNFGKSRHVFKKLSLTMSIFALALLECGLEGPGPAGLPKIWDCTKLTLEADGKVCSPAGAPGCCARGTSVHTSARAGCIHSHAVLLKRLQVADAAMREWIWTRLRTCADIAVRPAPAALGSNWSLAFKLTACPRTCVCCAGTQVEPAAAAAAASYDAACGLSVQLTPSPALHWRSLGMTNVDQQCAHARASRAQCRASTGAVPRADAHTHARSVRARSLLFSSEAITMLRAIGRARSAGLMAGDLVTLMGAALGNIYYHVGVPVCDLGVFV